MKELRRDIEAEPGHELRRLEADTQRGFDEMNQALKVQAEQPA